MKKFNIILLVIILSFVVSMASLSIFNSKEKIHHTKQSESAFDRVMRSKTLRCGYVVYAPTIIKDPNTGKMSGIMHDVIEDIAARLEIKVDWVEETTWANYMEGLNKRYDIVCAAAWANNLGEWPHSETVGPLFYSGINIWVRKTDTRFNNNITAINDSKITIASIDGTIPGRIAATDFPKAKILSLPQSGDHSLNLLNVINHKADVTMVENYTGNAFAANNPDSLKNITQNNPVRVYPNVFLVGKGEYKLQSMLQMVFNDMRNNGEVDKILSRYEEYPNSFYRVAKPYQYGN
ncbi:MAG TPA: transporter substrate-binding domain-containing protein [Alphaproteobacteria bacterium]